LIYVADIVYREAQGREGFGRNNLRHHSGGTQEFICQLCSAVAVNGGTGTQRFLIQQHPGTGVFPEIGP
jgi:hypothetical protein